MELREHAEALLFGRDLAGKLSRPGTLTDEAPGAALGVLPALPGRPPELRFLDPGESRPPEARFPDAKALGADRARGRIMHFFANHELLALELMALTLLRFPDAPAAFRRALAAVMIDEQKHLDLYLRRMEALGVAVGDLPCGRFFWDSLRAAPSPKHFLAGMSLTFEQANLDFSLHYLDLMREHDDHESRSVLQQVHDDEVRHVRRGLELFRGSLGDEELFADYRAHLEFPLGPHQGKGRPFSRSARRQAGLPGCFIDAMEAEAASRGRPPQIWLINPAVEEEIAGRAPGEVQRRIEQDLACTAALMTEPCDIVLVPEVPPLSLRLDLVRAGFGPVEWIEKGSARSKLGPRPLGSLRAFGRSPRSAEEARALGITEMGLGHEAWFRKSFALEVRAALALDVADEPWAARLHFPRARTCRSLDEALAAIGEGPVIIKTDLGSSGRGAFRIAGRGASRILGGRAPELDQDRDASRISRMIATGGAVIVEDLLDREADLSFHLDRLAEGSMRPRGLIRFHTDRRGQFLGAETAQALTTFPPEIQRFFAGEAGDEGWLDRLLARLTALLQREFATEVGDCGPLGIDMMLVRRADGGLRLQPLVEINPRLTMGRIALAAGRRIRRGCQGLFTIVSRPEEIESLRALAPQHPLRCSGEPSLIDGGLLLLGADDEGRRFLPLLAVAEARLEVLKALRSGDGA